jgi:hypothetical protein
MSKVFYGEAFTEYDAVEFINFKEFSNWKVLVAPFEVSYITYESTSEGNFATMQMMWGFVLHKFQE